jgi:translocator protein
MDSSSTAAGAERHEAPARGVALALIAVTMVAVAVVGGLATDTSSAWYQGLDRPSWQPPGAVFGPVWTVLYVLIGFAWWRAWERLEGPRRVPVLVLFAVNAVLNVGWTWIFFQAESPVAAGFEILALVAVIAALIALLWRPVRVAALSLVPYLAWVGFATALTWTIAARN